MYQPPHRRLLEGMKTALTAAALLVALAACSSQADEPAPKKDAQSGTPACSDVWQEGATLPADYEGCETADTIEAAVYYDCADGTRLTTFQDKWWALAGEKVHADPDGSGYSEAFAACKP